MNFKWKRYCHEIALDWFWETTAVSPVHSSSRETADGELTPNMAPSPAYGKENFRPSKVQLKRIKRLNIPFYFFGLVLSSWKALLPKTEQRSSRLLIKLTTLCLFNIDWILYCLWISKGWHIKYALALISCNELINDKDLQLLIYRGMILGRNYGKSRSTQDLAGKKQIRTLVIDSISARHCVKMSTFQNWICKWFSPSTCAFPWIRKWKARPRNRQVTLSWAKSWSENR